jgi:DNA replication protein DnaC
MWFDSRVVMLTSCGLALLPAREEWHGKLYLKTIQFAGCRSIRQNHSVQFVTVSTPVAMLAKAHSDGALEKQLTLLSRPKLLIIDELG